MNAQERSTIQAMQDARNERQKMAEDGKRPLYAIASDIERIWSQKGKGVYFGAVPYLNALKQLQSADQNYGYDDGVSIVLYALSNMSTFRGQEARELKAELKSHLPARYRK